MSNVLLPEDYALRYFEWLNSLSVNPEHVPFTIAQQTSHINETARYLELARFLAELDYVPSAIVQQTSYINELKAQLKFYLERLDQSSAAAQKERKNWKTSRDSTSARLKARMIGKTEQLDDKVKQKELKYIQALDEVNNSVAQKDFLNGEITSADELLAKLKGYMKEKEGVQLEIAKVLELVFGGETVALPEEDRLRQNIKLAEAAHDAVQLRLNAESQAVALLVDAISLFGRCREHLSAALTTSIITGSHISADVTKASTLSTHIDTFVKLAQRTSDGVKPIPTAQIPTISDVFSYVVFRERINDAINSVAEVPIYVYRELKAANDRARAITSETKLAVEVLQNARSELFNAYRVLLSEAGRDAALPAYNGPPSPPSTALNPYAGAFVRRATQHVFED